MASILCKDIYVVAAGRCVEGTGPYNNLFVLVRVVEGADPYRFL